MGRPFFKTREAKQSNFRSEADRYGEQETGKGDILVVPVHKECEFAADFESKKTEIEACRQR